MCVNEFIRTAKLPKELSRQVRDFFEFKLSRSQHSFLISGNYNVNEVSINNSIHSFPTR
jgi:hypothetical protein